jgi:hypothetical protein
VTAAASVTAAATVETATSMEASAKAGLPAGGEASRHSSMIKAAECTRVCASLGM